MSDPTIRADINFNEVVPLNTGSTFSAMCNRKLIAGVKRTNDIVDMKTNTGSRPLCNKGQVPGSEAEMFFDPKSVANAWVFKDVKDQCRATCDSAKDDAFLTHTENGIKKFEESRDSLCCYKLPTG